MNAGKIWVNSGDSHLLEPADLWTSSLPARLGQRAPRSVKSDRYEEVHIDGQVIHRTLAEFNESFRPPGASDLTIRLRDLDEEGVWGQLAFPSMAMWLYTIDDPELAATTVAAYNDWAAAEIIAHTGRVLPSAMVSVVSIDDAVKELERAVGLGFQSIFLPTAVPAGREYALDRWEPLWAAAAKADVLLAFHAGTGENPQAFRGPGGALINYWETTVPGQRAVTHLVAGGALDRHPELKVMVAEGGSSWIPALGDRLDEAYRQHGFYVRPKLSMLPSEYLYRQVYTSFQHDRSAIPVSATMDYRNVMWGDDYPHLEGTYGHTQQTLRELFDGVPAHVAHQVTLGCFDSLFHVPARPVSPAELATTTQT